MTTDHFSLTVGNQEKFNDLISLKGAGSTPTPDTANIFNSVNSKTHSPDIIVDSTEDKINMSGFLFNSGIVHHHGHHPQQQNIQNNNNNIFGSSSYEVSSSTSSQQDCQVSSSSSIGNIVHEIQNHPMYPLLIRLLQNCEMATSKTDSFPGNDTFLIELKQFIQLKMSNKTDNMNSDQKVDYLNQELQINLKNPNFSIGSSTSKKPDDSHNETPGTNSSNNGIKRRKSIKRTSDEDFGDDQKTIGSHCNLIAGLEELNHASSEDEEEALEENLANAKFEVLSKNSELDELMIRAIQVLRIHMLELQKVNELCKDFCARYTQSLKAKFQSETSLLDSQPSSPSESEPTSPSQLGFSGHGNFGHNNSSFNENGLEYLTNDIDKRRLNQDSRSSTTSNGSNSSSNILNHLSLSAHTAAALNASLDQMDSFNFSSSLSSGSRQKRGVLPKKATQIMKQWLFQHLVHPYPTEDEKRHIATQTNLTLLQVNNWFINARRRILQPMLDSTNHVTLLDGWSDEKEHPTIVNKKKKTATNRPSNNRFWPASLAAAAAIHPVAAGLIPVSSGNGSKSENSSNSQKIKTEQDETKHADNEEQKRPTRKRSKKTDLSSFSNNGTNTLMTSDENEASVVNVHDASSKLTASSLFNLMSKTSQNNHFESNQKSDYDDFWSYQKANMVKSDLVQSQLGYNFPIAQTNQISNGELFDSYENIYKKCRDTDYINSTYNNCMNLYNNDIINFNNETTQISTSTTSGSAGSTDDSTNKEPSENSQTYAFSSILNKNTPNKNNFMMSLWSDGSSTSNQNFSSAQNYPGNCVGNSVNHNNSVSNYFFQNDYLNPLWSQFSMGFSSQRADQGTQQQTDNTFDATSNSAYTTPTQQQNSSGYEFQLNSFQNNNSLSGQQNGQRNVYNQSMLNSDFNSICNKDSRLISTSNKSCEPTTIA